MNCSVVLEKDKYQPNTTGVMHLSCGMDEQIAEVLFADFGTPSGSCNGSSTGYVRRLLRACDYVVVAQRRWWWRRRRWLRWMWRLRW